MPHHPTFDIERVAAALEVEGELTAGLAGEAIALCADHFAAAGTTVRRVIDLGCGPGVATALLAEAFPFATVVAVDGSDAMLARAEARMARLGLASRVEARQLDLDGDLQALGACDLVWAAMAVHHAEDEVATLRRIRKLLRPQGLLCVLERADPMAVRLEASGSEWFEPARPTLPGALNAERYPTMLAAAGLEVLVSRTLSGTVAAPDDAATHAFLQARLPPPHPRWDGAEITSTRKLFIARPAEG